MCHVLRTHTPWHEDGDQVTRALVVLALLVLAGCGQPAVVVEPDESHSPTAYHNPENLHEYMLDLSDGRTVTCIARDQYRSGGLSCDWDGAK